MRLPRSRSDLDVDLDRDWDAFKEAHRPQLLIVAGMLIIYGLYLVSVTIAAFAGHVSLGGAIQATSLVLLLLGVPLVVFIWEVIRG